MKYANSPLSDPMPPRQEQEALCRELATCKAELQRTQGSIEKFSKALPKIQELQAQFSGLADWLQEEVGPRRSLSLRQLLPLFPRMLIGESVPCFVVLMSFPFCSVAGS